MTDDPLRDPVAILLKLGEPNILPGQDWPVYQEYGIGPEHIPELIGLAVNQALLSNPSESDPAAWAPVHAWRVLGQLHAQEAVIPLLNLLHQVKDNDWVIEELPDVFALIGSAVYEPLVNYLRDSTRPAYARMVAATSLMELGLTSQADRSRCMSALAEQLEEFKQNIPAVNGILIANLVELNAVEYKELIHKVFSDGKVDRFIVGDWRDIQKRLKATGSIIEAAKLRSTVRMAPPDPSHPEGKLYTESRTRTSGEPKTRPINPVV